MNEMWRSRVTGAKRRGTSVTELRRLFEEGVTVQAIAEPLLTVAKIARAEDVRATLRRVDFDVAGLADDDLSPVDGFVVREELTAGTCGEHAHSFRETDLVSDSTPLVDVLQTLQEARRRFVLAGIHIRGIVTRADLQKPPVRILVFGLISLFEMNQSFLIRRLYVDDRWTQALSPRRLDQARRLMEQRQQRNEDLELLDCLQLSDKRSLLLKSARAREVLGFTSNGDGERRLRAIEELRDRIAHSQDLVRGSNWEEVIRAVADVEELVRKVESFECAAVAGA